MKTWPITIYCPLQVLKFQSVHENLKPHTINAQFLITVAYKKVSQLFHALFTSISCDAFMESLKHANQPWVGFFAGARNSIKNCLSLL